MNLATATLSLFLLIPALVAHSTERESTRSSWNKPSFQGLWTNVSVTDLERKEGVSTLVLTAAEAAEIEDRDFYNLRIAEDAKPNDPNDESLLDGSDLLSGGGYNAFWVDPGKQHARVKGEIRSSWIVDPSDGRIPFSTEGAEKRRQTRALRNYDNPEARPLAERCLIGFGGTGGPPMLNVLYNNTYQIVQTENYLMILVEMVHDARIIPIDTDAKPGPIPQWLGNSVAHWEGDTLVIETQNWQPAQAQRGPIPLSAHGKVIERLTRYSDEQIFYEFIVEDPSYYSQTWRGEMSFNKTAGPVYEYACHEGNYALPGILRGAKDL